MRHGTPSQQLCELGEVLPFFTGGGIEVKKLAPTGLRLTWGWKKRQRLSPGWANAPSTCCEALMLASMWRWDELGVGTTRPTVNVKTVVPEIHHHCQAVLTAKRCQEKVDTNLSHEKKKGMFLKFKAREVKLASYSIIYLFPKTILVPTDNNFSCIMQSKEHRNGLKENRIIHLKIFPLIS